MSSVSVSTALSQILVVLCANQSLWGRCCCADPTKGTTVAVLLSTLQADYPASNFTDDSLRTLLARGRRMGLFRQIGSTDQWFIYTDFISVNPANAPFAEFCPGSICRPRAAGPVNQTTSVASP